MAPPSAGCVQVAPPSAAAGTVVALWVGRVLVDSVYWHVCSSCFVCLFVTQVTVRHSIGIMGRQAYK